MTAYVTVDNNWAIGCDGKDLVEVPENSKLIFSETFGKTVIMGRKTYENMQMGSLAPNCRIIVLSKKANYDATNVEVARDYMELKAKIEKTSSNDIFVLGGESVFREMLDSCDTVHVTRIDYEYRADKYFPDLDKMDSWSLDTVTEEHTYFDICYEFRMYKK